MQASGRDAVSWMASVNQQVSSGKQLSETAVGHIDGIRDSSQHVVDAVNDISTAISEQSSTTQSIAQQVEMVARLSEANSVTSKETEAVANDLDRLSANLRQTVSKFKV
jgi:methyl-accepting chemotaxis protein